MPKTITTITDAQKARFGEWTKKWTEIGLSTEPADFDAAEQAALACYKLCNLKKPKLVMRFGSPMSATVGGILGVRELGGRKASKVAASTSEVQNKLLPSADLSGNIAASLKSIDALKDVKLTSEETQGLTNYRGGSFWAGWCAYVSFLRDVLDWKNPTLKAFTLDEILTKSCGWVWWHEDVLAISDRPKEIHQDGGGRLHSITGPAISYRDGWSLYYVHGASVPSEWITGREKLDPSMALTWQNVEQRRALAEIIGWDKVLSSLKSKVIDKDLDPMVGTLFEVDLPDSPKSRFLRVQCGTGRFFSICVPTEMKTALDANAWSFNVNPQLIRKLEVRT